MVWSDGNGHHSKVREVEKGDICDEEEPEEFMRCPFEAHHGIHYKSIVGGLN